MAKRIFGMLVAILMLFSLALPCYAVDTYIVDVSGVADNADLDALNGIIGNSYATTGPLYKTYFRLEGGTKLFLHEDFDYLDYNDKVNIITDLASALQENTQISGTVKQAIYNSLADKIGDSYIAYIPEIVDATTADVLGGLSMFAPFRGTFGIVLGVAVILIALLLVLSTVIDIAYLISPNVMHWFLDETGDKPRARHLFISREARYCAEASIQGTLKGNIYLAYLGKRWATYLILSLCILYLLTGQIANLIGGFLDVAQSIV